MSRTKFALRRGNGSKRVDPARAGSGPASRRSVASGRSSTSGSAASATTSVADAGSRSRPARSGRGRCSAPSAAGTRSTPTASRPAATRGRREVRAPADAAQPASAASAMSCRSTSATTSVCTPPPWRSRDADVVVDSSKITSLAYVLSHSSTIDLRLLHILRDPRAVAYSWTKVVRRPEVAQREAFMPRYSPSYMAMLYAGHHVLLEALRLRGIRRGQGPIRGLRRPPVHRAEPGRRLCGAGPRREAALRGQAENTPASWQQCTR